MGLWAEERNLIYCVGETRLWCDVSVFPSSRRNWYDDEARLRRSQQQQKRLDGETKAWLKLTSEGSRLHVQYITFPEALNISSIEFTYATSIWEMSKKICDVIRKLLKAVSGFDSLLSLTINTCQVLFRNLTIFLASSCVDRGFDVKVAHSKDSWDVTFD